MKSVGIIGGGIIGLCCAYYLQKKGCKVTIIEGGELTDGCSWINAGMVVPSHVVPLAAPGMAARGLRWMFSRESPFAIRMKPDKDMLRWLRLFYRHSNKEYVEKAIPRLRDISLLSKSLYQEMDQEEDFDFGYRERGLLMLYQTASVEKEELNTARYANDAGVEARVLLPDEIRVMEPGTPPEVRGGIYFPGDAHLNPGKFMSGMMEHLKSKGVTFITHTPVIGFEYEKERIAKIKTARGDDQFDDYIVACGSQSGSLLKKSEIHLPLLGGKGYSFTLEGLPENVRIPSLLIEGRVAVTPIAADQLRVGGTMILGENDSAISKGRVNGILRTLHHFYPALKQANISSAQVSSGQRPCSPDGLPYIGRPGKFNNLYVATGHGMMGLSLGPATGKLISALITGNEPDMDIGAFGVDRFG